MKQHILYFPGLVAAIAGGSTAALAAVFQPVRSVLVVPMTYACAGVAVILFLRMLFDSRIHKAIEAANREMLGDIPSFKRIRLDDREWGLLGSQTGGKLLISIRLLLILEFFVSMFFSKKHPDISYLTFTSLFVTMMLSLRHLGLNSSTSSALSR